MSESVQFDIIQPYCSKQSTYLNRFFYVSVAFSTNFASMIKSSKILYLLVLCFGLSTCSNEFSVIAEWKNIPVVYGLLSPNDEFNYIRVEKAFLDPDEGADVLAQRPDSLYYENAIVTLSRESNGNAITLERVNAEDLGFTREDGTFATSPNFIYRYRTSDLQLNPDEQINLTITDGDTDQELATASTTVVGPYEFRAPNDPLTFRYESNFVISWASDELQARFYDIFMNIHYEEQDPNDPSIWIEKELLWEVESALERPVSGTSGFATRISYDFRGRQFYEFLAANIDDSITVFRRLTGVDVIVDAGGEALFNYVNIGSANTGITSNQVVPTFTNIENGRGVFSSRSRVVELDFNVSAISQDSLINGVITGHLNFQ